MKEGGVYPRQSVIGRHDHFRTFSKEAHGRNSLEFVIALDVDSRQSIGYDLSTKIIATGATNQ